MKNFKYFLLAIMASVVAISCTGGDDEGGGEGGQKAGGKIKEVILDNDPLFKFSYNAKGEITDVAVQDDIEAPAVNIAVTRGTGTLSADLGDYGKVDMILNTLGLPTTATYSILVAGENEGDAPVKVEIPIVYTYANGQLSQIKVTIGEDETAMNLTYAAASLTSFGPEGDAMQIKTSSYLPLCVPDVNMLLFASDLVNGAGLADTAPFAISMLLGLTPPTGKLISEVTIQSDMDYTDPENPVPVFATIPVKSIMSGERLSGVVFEYPEDMGGSSKYQFLYM